MSSKTRQKLPCSWSAQCRCRPVYINNHIPKMYKFTKTFSCCSHLSLDRITRNVDWAEPKWLRICSAAGRFSARWKTWDESGRDLPWSGTNNEWLLAGYKIVMSIVWGSRWELFIYQRNKQTSDILPSCKTMIWSTWGRKAIPCVTRIRVWQRREHRQSIWYYVCRTKCRGFTKICLSWKHPFYRNAISSTATIMEFRKWLYLRWFKVVSLFLCINL